MAKPGIGGGVMIRRAAHTSPPHFVFVSVYDDTTLNSYHTDVHTALSKLSNPVTGIFHQQKIAAAAGKVAIGLVSHWHASRTSVVNSSTGLGPKEGR